MKIITLLLVIIVVFMIYLGLARYVFAPKDTISQKAYLATGIFPVPLKEMPSLGASKYSYELWIYVNNVDLASSPGNYGKDNVGGNIFNINPSISLDIFNDGSAHVLAGSNPIEITKQFPLQRWEYLVINIDNNLIEIYLDGKLLRSMKSQQPIPTPTVDSVLSFGVSDIYVTGLYRNLFVLNQTEVFNKYLQGNNGYRLTNFSANIDFLKNKDVAYNYQFF